MALASHMGEYFGKTLVLEQWGYENCQKNGSFLLESPIRWYRVPAGFLPAVSSLGSWRPSEDLRPHEWVCSPYGGSSRKILVSWEIEV